MSCLSHECLILGLRPKILVSSQSRETFEKSRSYLGLITRSLSIVSVLDCNVSFTSLHHHYHRSSTSSSLTMLLFKSLQLDLIGLVLCFSLQSTNSGCKFIFLAWGQRKLRNCTRRCTNNSRQSLEFIADLQQTTRIPIGLGCSLISLSGRTFCRRP